ncbi:hypothetical protein [Bacillus songklensis]|uniref:hypothetical protein n=1 Tax=Bacillus songklensis TaxID=1069116 RepID=UPI003672535B
MAKAYRDPNVKGLDCVTNRFPCHFLCISNPFVEGRLLCFCSFSQRLSGYGWNHQFDENRKRGGEFVLGKRGES